MGFEPWSPWIRPAFLEPTNWEYALLGLQGLLSLVFLVWSRRDFARLGWRRLALFVGLLAAPLLVGRLFVLHFPHSGLLPPPGLPARPPRPSAPLLGALPVIAAGAWLGAGPAWLVGLVSGIVRARSVAGGMADPFHLAVFGFAVGFLLRQDYQGRLPKVARQPVVAALVSTPLPMLSLFLSVFARVARSGLSGFDYAATFISAYSEPMLLESVTAALVVQAVYAFRPRLRPVHVGRRSPPYARTLNRRLLFLFVPLTLVITAVLVYAVAATAVRLARSEAIDKMERDANVAAEGVLSFIDTGHGLLARFGDDEGLSRGDRVVLMDRLSRDLRTTAFFDQLLLFNSDGQRLAMYPPEPTGDPALTSQEQKLLGRALASGAPQISSAHRSRRDQPMLSFFTSATRPGDEDEGGAAPRVLLGRTRLDVNPVIGRVLDGLQWVDGRREGFVVDSEGRIVAHPQPDMFLREWQVDEDRPSIATDLRGTAYESRNPQDNTRELVYHLPVQGYPWSVVIRLPYKVVLEQAARIAAPLLFLQILLDGGLVIVISLVTNWLTNPLKRLASAADRIAEGDLTQPVQVAGEDEVGRVGEAFEDMRLRLKDRMDDLSLLLEVSQAVSATLELRKGMPSILEGALKATDADVARIVLLSEGGESQMAMSRGGLSGRLGGLDRALAEATKDRQQPLIVENLARARTLLGSDATGSPIRAAAALPVRTRKRVAAVIWIGYEEARQFDDSDVDLLSTLAGQTAVLVENARLFQTADGERRRLAAILASTTDAVLVTNRDNRVLLINPAAESAFGVTAEAVSNRKLDQTGLPATLAEAFHDPLPPVGALTKEMSLLDGRTLYANVSAIHSADGARIGRVAVMRDITHLKELDEMKSEFVATVSHDLRAPLTYMRGYASMMAAAGDLNDKQREYVERIMSGVGRMRKIVDDLLDLGRIEAGVGLERERCHLGAILAEVVEDMRARADTKGVTLTSKPTDRAAIVLGDAALLRQAIANLVDNAIKYTPKGGVVRVGLSVSPGKDRAVVSVADSGIGIAQEDQLRLFEKFYRVKGQDTSDSPGLGLGLSIVKSIAERHEGKVWADSELNKGSTFYISLPLY